MNSIVLYTTSILQFLVFSVCYVMQEYYYGTTGRSYDDLTPAFIFLIIFSCFNIPIHVLAVIREIEKRHKGTQNIFLKICSLIAFPFYIFWDLAYIINSVKMKEKDMIGKSLILIFSHYSISYLILFCIDATIQMIF